MNFQITRMRNHFGILLFLIGTNKLVAQDTLVFNTGEVELVSIKEISVREIKYKTSSNPDGPLYVIHKRTLSYYALQDGTKVFYHVPFIDSLQHANHVRVNPLDFAFGNISFSYEHYLTKDRKFALHFPMRIGNNYDQLKYKPGVNLISGAVGINYYIPSATRAKFYCGYELEYSYRHNVQDQMHYTYTDDYGRDHYDHHYSHYYGHYATHYITSGTKVYLNPSVGFNASVSLGVRDDLFKYWNHFAIKGDVGLFFAF
jgi:hypothetical protein